MERIVLVQDAFLGRLDASCDILFERHTFYCTDGPMPHSVRSRKAVEQDDVVRNMLLGRDGEDVVIRRLSIVNIWSLIDYVSWPSRNFCFAILRLRKTTLIDGLSIRSVAQH